LLYGLEEKSRVQESHGYPPELSLEQMVQEQMFVAGFQVRVWEIGEKTQKLVEVLKEHTSAVSCIQIKKDDRECVTASLDGTCVIWDIV